MKEPDGPAAPRSQPPLVTIHGINSSGAWQEALRPVFAPHFRCISIYYPHYRFLGATKILIEPLILGAVAIAFLFAFAMGARPGFALLASAGAAGLIVSYLAAGLRRRSAFHAVLRKFDEAALIGERPCVIAHSFGTYLSGRLLKRPTTRCSRLIFAGSVLATEFPTRRLPQQGPMPFEEIRNEVGTDDLPVRLAGFVRKLVPDLGNAGIRGFASDGIHVHELDRPNQKCRQCGPIGSRPTWVIHNVKLDEYEHSDHFITPKHAIQFWLPTLLGIDVQEFVDWLEWCDLAAQAGSGGRFDRVALIAEKQLVEQQWSWADGATIRDFIVQQYPSMGAQLEDPITALRIYRIIWKAAVSARNVATSHEYDPERMARARALDPRIAVFTAVGVVGA